MASPIPAPPRPRPDMPECFKKDFDGRDMPQPLTKEQIYWEIVDINNRVKQLSKDVGNVKKYFEDQYLCNFDPAKPGADQTVTMAVKQK